MLKKSVILSTHATSISMEPEFWDALQIICTHEKTTVPKLLTMIDNTRTITNLSSAVRVYILTYFLNKG